VLVPHLLRIGPRRLERLVLALLGALTIWLGYRSFPVRPAAVPGTDEAQEVSAILPAPGIELAAPSFDGVFDGRMSDRSGSRPVRATLWRQRERITGTYRDGLGHGEIAGVVDGDTLGSRGNRPRATAAAASAPAPEAWSSRARGDSGRRRRAAACGREHGSGGDPRVGGRGRGHPAPAGIP
jgi:hypothetical protein